MKFCNSSANQTNQKSNYTLQTNQAVDNALMNVLKRLLEKQKASSASLIGKARGDIQTSSQFREPWFYMSGCSTSGGDER